MRDRGSMMVLVMLVGVALTSAITLAMVPVLVDLSDRQQARSAADAAALAGVVGGRDAAVRLAAANDGELVGWWRIGDHVVVEVRVGSQTMSARAAAGP